MFAQSFKPSIPVFREHPEMLYTVFCLLTPSTILMLFCALYELTTFDHQRREQLFHPHLSKVFFSAMASFFTCIVFAHWLQ